MERKQNITWYNPPFNKGVATNIGRQFLKIVDNVFTADHPLRKIFNRNTIKVSYSTMPNIQQIINKHNAGLMKNNHQPPADTGCNCRDKNQCPLPGKCKTSSLIYQATVTSENEGNIESYIGLTEGTFKTRYNNHKTTFTNVEKRNSTALSKYIWSLKDKNIGFSIKWSIIQRSIAYTNGSSRCNLGNLEKYYIICHPELATLNRRNELATNCKHIAKYLLKNCAIT